MRGARTRDRAAWQRRGGIVNGETVEAILWLSTPRSQLFQKHWLTLRALKIDGREQITRYRGGDATPLAGSSFKVNSRNLRAPGEQQVVIEFASDLLAKFVPRQDSRMLSYLRDQFSAARLRARYRRLVQERLLELAEGSSQRVVAEEGGDWQLLGGTKGSGAEWNRTHIRDRARQLVRENPHACNILRLLESYVVGPGLQLSLQPEGDASAATAAAIPVAMRLWRDCLRVNGGHYEFREHARRVWRDGECFLRKFENESWPPSLRFVDPELIDGGAAAPASQGILCDPHDAETAITYLCTAATGSEPVERIPAEEMIQTRIGVDSNEKRGVSFFAPLLDALSCYEKWLETEMLARKLQSSIVLWRKVQGGPGIADAMADRAGDGGRKERFAPGSILTTNQGTDIQFLQPNTNFGDAVPLGRMLLLSVAAGAGLPEFMLTADAANANFASTMIAEGPAVKFFESQQQFFKTEFTKLWRWVMEQAVSEGLLPDGFLMEVTANWTFPSLVSRDRAKERMADVRLLESGVLSRAEVARRDNVNPATMREERDAEERT